DDHIRLSYATSMTNLEKSMDRIVKALAKLKPAKKARRALLDNTVTRVRRSVPVEAAVDGRMRDALVAEMEGHLGYEGRFEWNATINGVIIQLRTNVAHLNDFWTENWSPAQLEADLEPHGTIYGVDGIAGREPRAFYNSETKTGVLVNTDNYGPLRSLALGLVLDIAERMAGTGGVGAVRGMSADIGGSGLILVGPPGTKKTELFFELLADRRFKLHANDIAFVRLTAGRAVADCVERKLYLPTNTVELDGRLAALLDRSKCENVVLHKEDCTDEACQRVDDCRLDRGSPYCYKASKEAHGMLDPNWLGGPASFVRRTDLKWLFLLRNDATSPALVDVGKDEALRILEAGEAAGAKKSLTAVKSQPFFNPHWLPGIRTDGAAAAAGADRVELEKAFFGRLLDVVKCYLVNSGVAGADKIKEVVGA
ncbi:MAG TPA: hypothetical protein VEG35_04295, partial [Burkholderiales bacterium]|nr:hypothetical protein [Burkholderiales bacterium]